MTLGMNDLTTAGLRRVPGVGYNVYVVRDALTGEFLKVGQTDYLQRFLPYRTRAIKENRQIAVDVFGVDKAVARRLIPTLESQMQINLFKQGHSLPWDNSHVLKNLRGKP